MNNCYEKAVVFLHRLEYGIAAIAGCFQWLHLSLLLTFSGTVCCESMLHVAVCEITGEEIVFCFHQIDVDMWWRCVACLSRLSWSREDYLWAVNRNIPRTNCLYVVRISTFFSFLVSVSLTFSIYSIHLCFQCDRNVAFVR